MDIIKLLDLIDVNGLVNTSGFGRNVLLKTIGEGGWLFKI